MGCGDELVVDWRDFERVYDAAVAAEVADVGIVVQREVADRVVTLGGRVDYVCGCVGEFCEVAAVFFAVESFGVFSRDAVVELEGFVVCGRYAELPLVVKVQRRDFCAWRDVLECLRRPEAVDRVGELDGFALPWGAGGRDGGGGHRAAERRG